jgi:hypothetical protein
LASLRRSAEPPLRGQADGDGKFLQRNWWRGVGSNMRELKVFIAVVGLSFALLFIWAVCINFKISSDLPITVASCWLAGISLFLIVKRNLPLSKMARSLFLLNFGLCGVLLLVVGIPNFIQARATSCCNACINSLRQIDAAANQFALDHGKTNGEAVNFPNDLTPYIKLNSVGKISPCPNGGIYSLKRIGEVPTCSLGTGANSAHVLP